MIRRFFAALLAIVVLAMPAHARDYRYFLVGKPRVATPDQTSGGLLLMGGGDRNIEALRWFTAKAGHGHIVVLSGSYGREIGDELYRKIGGVASVETFVFKNRRAATDPRILRSLAHADGIFIAGGDQSRYVRYWRGTPVAAALDAHVAAGKPLGGTSAGLAMLGDYLYGAMDGGSLTSTQALADPLGAANTIESDFLHLAALRDIITDSHFKERDRLGRLFAMLAKAESLAGRPLFGLGVDESAALAVESDGSARIYSTAPDGGAWLVRGGFAERQTPGAPLSLAEVHVTGIGLGSVVELPAARVTAPAFVRRYRVEKGVMREITP